MTNTYNISIVDNTSITRIIRFYYHKCILSVILPLYSYILNTRTWTINRDPPFWGLALCYT